MDSVTRDTACLPLGHRSRHFVAIGVAIARGSRLSPSAWPSQTFGMTITVLRPSPREVLERQAVLHGYQDPDPDHDHLGLTITAGPQHRCKTVGG